MFSNSPDKPSSPPVIVPMDEKLAPIVPILNDCVFVLFLALVFGLGPVSIAAYLNTRSTVSTSAIAAPHRTNSHYGQTDNIASRSVDMPARKAKP